MTRPSIVRQFPDAAADATFMTYGPMSLESSGGDSGGVEIVETFGEYEAEYAAIRRGVGVVETPQRGVVVVGGADRLSFLQSMLTNDVGTLVAGQGRRAFLLGKTGRIIADVLALERGDRTLLVVDRLDAPKLIAELDKYVITEDVQLSDVSEKWVVIGLHGPGGVGLVEEMSHAKPQALTGAWEKLEQRVVTLAGRETIVVRHDEAGVLGLHVMIEASGAGVLYGELLERAKASGWNSAPLPLGEGGEKRSAEPG